MRSKKQQIELTVEHLGRELTHLFPFHGPDSYLEVRAKLNENGFTMATMPQVVSIIYDACFTKQSTLFDTEQAEEIISLTYKNSGIYTASKSLWIPDEGVKVFPDDDSIPLGAFTNKIGKLTQMELSFILEQLKKHPDSVNQTDFGFKTGEMSPLELTTNSYVKALVGEEGAEKLAEISSRHHCTKPYLSASNKVKKPLITDSNLFFYSGFCPDVVNVRSRDNDKLEGGSLGGYAFAIPVEN
jgi:hypothetical protein